MNKKFVKIKGSDDYIEYPQIRVNNPDGTFYYTDDKTRAKIVKTKYPKILEDNCDGTYTAWTYTVFGPVGEQGTLKSGIEISELKTKSDFAAAERIIDLINKSLKSQEIMYSLMKNHYE